MEEPMDSTSSYIPYWTQSVNHANIKLRHVIELDNNTFVFGYYYYNSINEDVMSPMINNNMHSSKLLIKCNSDLHHIGFKNLPVDGKKFIISYNTYNDNSLRIVKCRIGIRCIEVENKRKIELTYSQNIFEWTTIPLSEEFDDIEYFTLSLMLNKSKSKILIYCSNELPNEDRLFYEIAKIPIKIKPNKPLDLLLHTEAMGTIVYL